MFLTFLGRLTMYNVVMSESQIMHTNDSNLIRHVLLRGRKFFNNHLVKVLNICRIFNLITTMFENIGNEKEFDAF